MKSKSPVSFLWLARVSTVFATTMGLAQFFEMELTPRLLVGTLTGVAVLLAVLFSRKDSRYGHLPMCARVLRSLAKRPVGAGVDDDFVFVPAKTEAQYLEVCAASREVYGEDYTGPDVTVRWWKRFPLAVFAAYSKRTTDLNRLVAYFSVWPISRACYRKLRSGQLREADISPRSIQRLDPEKHYKYWFVANIVMLKEYRRRPHLLKALLVRGVREWGERVRPTAGTNLLAAAYSDEGTDLLKRLGFRGLGRTTPEGWNLYELEADGQALRSALNEALVE